MEIILNLPQYPILYSLLALIGLTAQCLKFSLYVFLESYKLSSHTIIIIITIVERATGYHSHNILQCLNFHSQSIS